MVLWKGVVILFCLSASFFALAISLLAFNKATGEKLTKLAESFLEGASRQPLEKRPYPKSLLEKQRERSQEVRYLFDLREQLVDRGTYRITGRYLKLIQAFEMSLKDPNLSQSGKQEVEEEIALYTQIVKQMLKLTLDQELIQSESAYSEELKRKIKSKHQGES